jgi:hypothetical protein
MKTSTFRPGSWNAADEKISLCHPLQMFSDHHHGKILRVIVARTSSESSFFTHSRDYLGMPYGFGGKTFMLSISKSAKSFLSTL